MPLLDVEVYLLDSHLIDTTTCNPSNMNAPSHLAGISSANEIYVRQSIEAGLADSKAGRIVDVTAVRERFGLPS